jgi:hypothetical protein
MRSSLLGSLVLAVPLVVVLAAPASATPTGLNNIPTADVVDSGVLVLQGFSQFGEGRSPAWFAGLKYGPAENWEVGLDDAFAGPNSNTGPTLQVKYRFAPSENVGLALGAANLTTDRERNGDTIPYLVLTAPLGPTVRGHLGYSAQQDNNACFLGVDGPVGDELTVRADWAQVEDGDESVASLGFISSLSSRWLVEVWASFPTAEEAENDFIVKFDFVIPVGRG